MRRRHWLEVSPTGVEEVDECLKIEELGAHLIAVHSARHVIEVHSVVEDTHSECLSLSSTLSAVVLRRVDRH